MPRWTIGVLSLVLLGGVIGAGFYAARDPGIHLLIAEDGARWIRLPRPFELSGSGATQEIVQYRRLVDIPAGNRSGTTILRVKAFRSCSIYWDGRVLYQARSQQELADQQYAASERHYRHWKEPHDVVLPEIALSPGRHELLISVDNSCGPTAVLAHCSALKIRTGEDWECRFASKDWQAADDVTHVTLPALSQKFSGTTGNGSSGLPWVILIFAGTWVMGAWFHRRSSLDRSDRPHLSSNLRWYLLAAWTALAIRNFNRLPVEMGYDLAGHVAYINYILQHHALPLATDGPQMFQSPLYYVLSAILHAFLSVLISTESAWLWLRGLPLLCGLAQVQLCYRAARVVFPNRQDLQCVALLVGGLLPVNIVMSHALGNEPLCGFFTGVILILCLKGITDPEFAGRPRTQWLLGLLMGLAILAKISALLLVIPVGFVVANSQWSKGPAGSMAGQFRWITGAVLVSGWYFARNWIHFDKMIIGGWNPGTRIVWWQDPGFRTPQQLLTFGKSLWHPIHAGFYSIWDGFYSTLWWDGNLSAQGTWEDRPPWNYRWMLCAPWLGLALSGLIIAGMLRSLRARDRALRSGLQLAAGTLLIFLLAFAWLCLRMPIYSQAKASYTLGLTPLYAVLCAAGFELLPRHWLIRSAAWALLATWCITVYSTYFIW
jgi:hypothetical protein